MADSLGATILSLHYFFFEIEDEATGDIRKFALIELAAGESIRRALDRYYEETINRSADRRGTSIILRPPVKFPISKKIIEQLVNGKPKGQLTRQQKPILAFLTDALEDNERTFERFANHHVYILASHNYSHFLSENINEHAAGMGSVLSEEFQANLIDRIRDAEIDHLVEQGHCRLPALNGAHYRVPSGRYVKTFLRVGNLQRSRAALDAIFFWLVPYLRNCVGIITDTWSITSISQNVSRRLTDYANAMEPCPIEMIGDYDDATRKSGRLRAAGIVSRFVERVSQQSPKGVVLILISATHTGSVQANLAQFLSDRGLSKRVEFVSLFKLSEASPVPYLRDLSNEEGFGSCEGLSREQKEAAVDIDGSIYFPIREKDIEKYVHVPTVKRLRPFLDSYGDAPIFRVHHNDDFSFPDPRHHAIWLDTIALIQHPKFRHAFREVLSNLQPQPSVVVSPSHMASTDLQNLAKETLGSSAKFFLHPDLNLISSYGADKEIIDAISAVPDSGAILLLDDAFVTGTRVAVYQANLREREFGGVFHYLAAVARPEKNAHWESQRRTFMRARADKDFEPTEGVLPNTFTAVEKIVLPNWGHDQCPWCVEAAVQRQLSPDIRRPELLSAPEGLEQGLFALPPGAEQPELLAGSLFASKGCLQANVFAAVASVLQEMRTDVNICSPCLGSTHFLVATVLHHDEYIKRYSDSLLAGSLLRAALPGELIYRGPGAERRRTEQWINICRAKDPARFAEVAVALRSDKFPELEPGQADVAPFLENQSQ